MSAWVRPAAIALASVAVGIVIGHFIDWEWPQPLQCGFSPEVEEESFWPPGSGGEEPASILVDSNCNRWAAGSLENWIQVLEPDYNLGPGELDLGAHGEAPVEFTVASTCSDVTETPGGVTRHLGCGPPRAGEILLFQTFGFDYEPGRGSIAIEQGGLSAPPQIAGGCYAKPDGLYYRLTWPDFPIEEGGLEQVIVPWMKIGDSAWEVVGGLRLDAREAEERIEGAPLWPISFRLSLATLSIGPNPQYHSPFSNVVTCQAL